MILHSGQRWQLSLQCPPYPCMPIVEWLQSWGCNSAIARLSPIPVPALPPSMWTCDYQCGPHDSTIPPVSIGIQSNFLGQPCLPPTGVSQRAGKGLLASRGFLTLTPADATAPLQRAANRDFTWCICWV